MNVQKIMNLKKGDTIIIDNKEYNIYTDPIKDISTIEISTNSETNKHTIIHLSHLQSSTHTVGPLQLFILKVSNNYEDQLEVFIQHVDYEKQNTLRKIDCEKIKIK